MYLSTQWRTLNRNSIIVAIIILFNWPSWWQYSQLHIYTQDEKAPIYPGYGHEHRLSPHCRIGSWRNPADMNTQENHSAPSYPDFPWAWVTGLGWALSHCSSYTIMVNAPPPTAFCTFIGRSNAPLREPGRWCLRWETGLEVTRSLQATHRIYREFSLEEVLSLSCSELSKSLSSFKKQHNSKKTNKQTEREKKMP